MDRVIHIVPEWVELTSVVFCFGAIACRLWVLPPAASSPATDHKFIERMWRLFCICISAIALSSIVNLLMRSSEITGRPVYSVFPLLPTVLFRSHIGLVWLIRITSLALLSIAYKAVVRSKYSRVFPGFMLLALIIITMTESASGHAADKGDFSIPEIMDWLHLAGASLWGGGLFTLALFILPELLSRGEEAASRIAAVARRFSAIATAALSVVALTAVYNAVVYVGGYRELIGNLYGRTVLVKIVLFFALANLGAVNHYVNVPLLQEWGGFRNVKRGMLSGLAISIFSRVSDVGDGRRTALRFGRSVRIEAALVACLLLCAAILRHEIPARHLSHLLHSGKHHAPSGPAPVVSLSTEPGILTAGSPAVMTLSIKDPEGRPLKGLDIMHERILHAIIIGRDLRVFAHIHPEDLGPVTRDMMEKAAFPLRFTFPEAGKYILGTDFAASGESYSRVFPLSVKGKQEMGAPVMDLARQKLFGQYHVRLKVSPPAPAPGETATLKYLIEKNGKAATDLNPYLGAAMHLAIVSSDLASFIHAHGTLPGEPAGHHDHMHMPPPPKRFGPEIDADVVFPSPGVYKIFAQVMHEGKVLLFDFMVDVKQK